MDINTIESGAFKPEIIKPDKLFVPDIHLLTTVSLPKEVDLRNTESITEILGSLVEEEKNRNPLYQGMFLFGSVAHDTANNGSDIDGLHVVEGSSSELSWDVIHPMQYRLRAIFDICYRIPFQDNRAVLFLRDPEFSIKNAADELDKQSVPIGISENIVEQMKNTTSFHLKERFTGSRPFKKPSTEIGPHPFIFPRDGIFPWYIEYGLLERLFN